MIGYLSGHPLIDVLSFYVFSAIVSGMPEPVPASSAGYQWLYHSLHILSGDLSSVVGSKGIRP